MSEFYLWEKWESYEKNYLYWNSKTKGLLNNMINARGMCIIVCIVLQIAHASNN